MIVKKLRRPCRRCGVKFAPDGKFQWVCNSCQIHKGNLKGINVSEVRRWLMN